MHPTTILRLGLTHHPYINLTRPMIIPTFTRFSKGFLLSKAPNSVSSPALTLAPALHFSTNFPLPFFRLVHTTSTPTTTTPSIHPCSSSTCSHPDHPYHASSFSSSSLLAHEAAAAPASMAQHPPLTPCPNSIPEFNATHVHEWLERGGAGGPGSGIVGVYGGDHAVYHAVAEAQSGKKLQKLKGAKDTTTTMTTAAATSSLQTVGNGGAPTQRTFTEWHVPELETFLKDPTTRINWDKIVSFDPYGMFSTRPTISATIAKMEIPEIIQNLFVDGRVVNQDKSINCIKIAIDPVWNIPGLSERLGLEESHLRQALFDWTQVPALLDPKNKVFLPSIGGTTVYIFGDIRAITDPKRPVATRPHDECNGSDVFGTDICTCRPYLVYALQGAVETAQKNGCGIVAYFRKEGRAFGEVTKFRVYNLRRYQEGGDRPETYFKMTEHIAGLVDARVQPLMPDVYHWLGVTKIDRLLSMSKDKYTAITDAGLQVIDRVSLPEDMVPSGAHVEISAKISSGYNAFQPKQTEGNSSAALYKLETIRERCNALFQIGLDGGLPNFTLNIDKLPGAVSRVINTIRRHYPDFNIPYHSRLRHFDAGGTKRMSELISRWNRFNIDMLEITRREIDLIVVSVLLDAGAGHKWHYIDHTTMDTTLNRSEGLAVATLDMFRTGTFSSDAMHTRVDSQALGNLDIKTLELGFQVREDNPLVGLQGRYEILLRLSKALENNPKIFAGSDGLYRPGNLVDYVLREAYSGSRKVSIRLLWKAIMDGFSSAFPDYSGLGFGDAYKHPCLNTSSANPYDHIVPFHKLSQWLAYSLVEPFEKLGINFVDTWLLTGLAEYRNGGLFVDSGVIVPKHPQEVLGGKKLKVTSEPIVEWRALTVSLVDRMAVDIWDRLGKTEREMPLSQILEGGTWRAGRELAYEKREGGDAPILIDSSGDVF